MHESINTVERTQQTEQCRASEWSIVAWEGHNLLMNQRNKPRESTHTHTHARTRPPPSSQIRSSLLPLRCCYFSQHPLLEQHKPDQGEESGTQPSSCGSCGLSSVEAEGVPVVGEDGNWCHFLWDHHVGLTS